MKLKRKEITADGEIITEKENDWPQIIAIFIGSLSGFSDGLHFSWGSPFILKITTDKVNYDINEEQASFFNTLYPLAMLIGCPFFSALSDVIGRKRTMLIEGLLHVLSWLLAAFARDIYVFYASRIFSGLALACFFAVFPMYIGEIANPRVRGTWGNATATSLYFGQMTINIIGSYFDVQQTSFICLPLPILFMILFSRMPETPYFFIMKGKDESAKKALKFLTRKQNVDKDFLDLKSDVQRQLSESGNWSDLVKISSNRKALLAGIFLRVAQHTSGLTIFATFTQTVFQKSGVGYISHQLSSIIYGAIVVVLNIFVTSSVVPRFSRKNLFIISLMTSAVVLYILGTYFYMDAYTDVDFSSFNWVPITGLLVYQVFASIGICVIPTLMMSELFSTSIKAKGMSVLLIFMGGGLLIINTSFYYIIEFIGFYAPFYLYGVCNTLATILSFYLIPETKGKTLEEIQQMLKKKK